jgi:hypothetical protein
MPVIGRAGIPCKSAVFCGFKLKRVKSAWRSLALKFAMTASCIAPSPRFEPV